MSGTICIAETCEIPQIILDWDRAKDRKSENLESFVRIRKSLFEGIIKIIEFSRLARQNVLNLRTISLIFFCSFPRWDKFCYSACWRAPAQREGMTRLHIVCELNFQYELYFLWRLFLTFQLVSKIFRELSDIKRSFSF